MLPRHPLGRVALALLTVLSVVHLVAQWTGTDAVSEPTQWFLMPLLALVLFVESPAPRGRLVNLVLVALGLSWLGDTAPDLTSGDPAFLVMIAFFLLAQVTYIVAFRPFAAHSVLHRRRALLPAYVVAVVALVAVCAPEAGGLLVPVLVYGLCLGTMAVLSTGVNAVTGAGGALFLVSDGLIALDAFGPDLDLPHIDFWVMLTYIAAQALIVAGVLRHEERTPLSGAGSVRMPSQRP